MQRAAKVKSAQRRAVESEVRFKQASRSLLSRHDLGRFTGATLFDTIGRELCEADCIPRKELFESWEVARRVRRRFRGRRVVDLACGHGLTAWIMLLLDRSSPCALAVDHRLPASAHTLYATFARRWPELASRIELVEVELDSVELTAGDVVVSAHACGALTDRILERASRAAAHVAVLPCCHDARGDQGGVGGWVDSALAIDLTRAARLRSAGYTVHTQTIPASITPKNRLLLAAPGALP
jgi:hypothetical protein